LSEVPLYHIDHDHDIKEKERERGCEREEEGEDEEEGDGEGNRGRSRGRGRGRGTKRERARERERATTTTTDPTFGSLATLPPGLARRPCRFRVKRKHLQKLQGRFPENHGHNLALNVLMCLIFFTANLKSSPRGDRHDNNFEVKHLRPTSPPPQLQPRQMSTPRQKSPQRHKSPPPQKSPQPRGYGGGLRQQTPPSRGEPRKVSLHHAFNASIHSVTQIECVHPLCDTD